MQTLWAQLSLGSAAARARPASQSLLFSLPSVADEQLKSAESSFVSLAAPVEKRCLTSTGAERIELFPSGLVTGAVSKGACGRGWKLAPWTAAWKEQAAGLPGPTGGSSRVLRLESPGGEFRG